jgi:sigma-E factor negative regulatory protein RseA
MERISALMDGELEDGDAAAEIRRLGAGEDHVETWAMYHLIGDALRGEPVVGAAVSRAMRERLAAEPTILAPRRSSVARKARLYALSAAASVAGMAVVGWLAYMNQPGRFEGAGPSMAGGGAQPAALALDESMVREYLLAHQQHSPSSSVQGVATYIRTVGMREGGTAR